MSYPGHPVECMCVGVSYSSASYIVNIYFVSPTGRNPPKHYHLEFKEAGDHLRIDSAFGETSGGSSCVEAR